MTSWETERDDRGAHGLARGDQGELLNLHETHQRIEERKGFLRGLLLKGRLQALTSVAVSGLSASLRTEISPVRFPARALSYVTGQVPAGDM